MSYVILHIEKLSLISVLSAPVKIPASSPKKVKALKSPAKKSAQKESPSSKESAAQTFTFGDEKIALETSNKAIQYELSDLEKFQLDAHTDPVSSNRRVQSLSDEIPIREREGQERNEQKKIMYKEIELQTEKSCSHLNLETFEKEPVPYDGKLRYRIAESANKDVDTVSEGTQADAPKFTKRNIDSSSQLDQRISDESTNKRSSGTQVDFEIDTLESEPVRIRGQQNDDDTKEKRSSGTQADFDFEILDREPKRRTAQPQTSTSSQGDQDVEILDREPRRRTAQPQRSSGTQADFDVEILDNEPRRRIAQPQREVSTSTDQSAERRADFTIQTLDKEPVRHSGKIETKSAESITKIRPTPAAREANSKSKIPPSNIVKSSRKEVTVEEFHIPKVKLKPTPAARRVKADREEAEKLANQMPESAISANQMQVSAKSSNQKPGVTPEAATTTTTTTNSSSSEEEGEKDVQNLISMWDSKGTGKTAAKKTRPVVRLQATRDTDEEPVKEVPERPFPEAVHAGKPDDVTDDQVAASIPTQYYVTRTATSTTTTFSDSSEQTFHDNDQLTIDKIPGKEEEKSESSVREEEKSSEDVMAEILEPTPGEVIQTAELVTLREKQARHPARSSQPIRSSADQPIKGSPDYSSFADYFAEESNYRSSIVEVDDDEEEEEEMEKRDKEVEEEEGQSTSDSSDENIDEINEDIMHVSSDDSNDIPREINPLIKKMARIEPDEQETTSEDDDDDDDDDDDSDDSTDSSDSGSYVPDMSTAGRRKAEEERQRYEQELLRQQQLRQQLSAGRYRPSRRPLSIIHEDEEEEEDEEENQRKSKKSPRRSPSKYGAEATILESDSAKDDDSDSDSDSSDDDDKIRSSNLSQMKKMSYGSGDIYTEVHNDGLDTDIPFIDDDDELGDRSGEAFSPTAELDFQFDTSPRKERAPLILTPTPPPTPPSPQKLTAEKPLDSATPPGGRNVQSEISPPRGQVTIEETSLSYESPPSPSKLAATPSGGRNVQTGISHDREQVTFEDASLSYKSPLSPSKLDATPPGGRYQHKGPLPAPPSSQVVNQTETTIPTKKSKETDFDIETFAEEPRRRKVHSPRDLHADKSTNQIIRDPGSPREASSPKSPSRFDAQTPPSSSSESPQSPRFLPAEKPIEESRIKDPKTELRSTEVITIKSETIDNREVDNRVKDKKGDLDIEVLDFEPRRRVGRSRREDSFDDSTDGKPSIVSKLDATPPGGRYQHKGPLPAPPTKVMQDSPVETPRKKSEPEKIVVVSSAEMMKIISEKLAAEQKSPPIKMSMDIEEFEFEPRRRIGRSSSTESSPGSDQSSVSPSPVTPSKLDATPPGGRYQHKGALPMPPSEKKSEVDTQAKVEVTKGTEKQQSSMKIQSGREMLPPPSAAKAPSTGKEMQPPPSTAKAPSTEKEKKPVADTTPPSQIKNVKRTVEHVDVEQSSIFGQEMDAKVKRTETNLDQSQETWDLGTQPSLGQIRNEKRKARSGALPDSPERQRETSKRPRPKSRGTTEEDKDIPGSPRKHKVASPLDPTTPCKLLKQETPIDGTGEAIQDGVFSFKGPLPEVPQSPKSPKTPTTPGGVKIRPAYQKSLVEEDAPSSESSAPQTPLKSPKRAEFGEDDNMEGQQPSAKFVLPILPVSPPGPGPTSPASSSQLASVLSQKGKKKDAESSGLEQKPLTGGDYQFTFAKPIDMGLIEQMLQNQSKREKMNNEEQKIDDDEHPAPNLEDEEAKESKKTKEPKSSKKKKSRKGRFSFKGKLPDAPSSPVKADQDDDAPSSPNKVVPTKKEIVPNSPEKVVPTQKEIADFISDKKAANALAAALKADQGKKRLSSTTDGAPDKKIDQSAAKKELSDFSSDKIAADALAAALKVHQEKVKAKGDKIIEYIEIEEDIYETTIVTTPISSPPMSPVHMIEQVAPPVIPILPPVKKDLRLKMSPKNTPSFPSPKAEGSITPKTPISPFSSFGISENEVKSPTSPVSPKIVFYDGPSSPSPIPPIMMETGQDDEEDDDFDDDSFSDSSSVDTVLDGKEHKKPSAKILNDVSAPSGDSTEIAAEEYETEQIYQNITEYRSQLAEIEAQEETPSEKQRNSSSTSSGKEKELYHSSDEDFDSFEDEDLEDSPKHSGDEYEHLCFHLKGGIGFKVIGGNKTGIFIESLKTDSPASGEGLKEGDQIMKINGKDMRGKTREDAMLSLLSIRDKMELAVQSNKAMYDIVKKSGGAGDFFFIRTHFSYNMGKGEEFNFKIGDIFLVTDTLPNDVVGTWKAVSMSDGSDNSGPGLLPSEHRAEQMALSQLKGPPQRRRERSRSPFRKKGGKEAENEGKQPVNPRLPYERVVLSAPKFPRPIIIQGPFAEIAKEKLVEDLDEKFESPPLPKQKSAAATEQEETEIVKDLAVLDVIEMDSVRAIMKRGKHCVLVNVARKVIDYLMTTKTNPIVIVLKPESKTVVRELRSKWLQKGRRESVSKLYEEGIQADKEFIGFSNITLDLANIDNWFIDLQKTIDVNQKKQIWLPELTNDGTSSSAKSLDWDYYDEDPTYQLETYYKSNSTLTTVSSMTLTDSSQYGSDVTLEAPPSQRSSNRGSEDTLKDDVFVDLESHQTEFDSKAKEWKSANDVDAAHTEELKGALTVGDIPSADYKLTFDISPMEKQPINIFDDHEERCERELSTTPKKRPTKTIDPQYHIDTVILANAPYQPPEEPGSPTILTPSDIEKISKFEVKKPPVSRRLLGSIGKGKSKREKRKSESDAYLDNVSADTTMTEESVGSDSSSTTTTPTKPEKSEKTGFFKRRSRSRENVQDRPRSKRSFSLEALNRALSERSQPRPILDRSVSTSDVLGSSRKDSEGAFKRRSQTSLGGSEKNLDEDHRGSGIFSSLRRRKKKKEERAQKSKSMIVVSSNESPVIPKPVLEKSLSVAQVSGVDNEENRTLERSDKKRGSGIFGSLRRKKRTKSSDSLKSSGADSPIKSSESKDSLDKSQGDSEKSPFQRKEKGRGSGIFGSLRRKKSQSKEKIEKTETSPSRKSSQSETPVAPPVQTSAEALAADNKPMVKSSKPKKSSLKKQVAPPAEQPEKQPKEEEIDVVKAKSRFKSLSAFWSRKGDTPRDIDSVLREKPKPLRKGGPPVVPAKNLESPTVGPKEKPATRSKPKTKPKPKPKPGKKPSVAAQKPQVQEVPQPHETESELSAEHVQHERVESTPVASTVMASTSVASTSITSTQQEFIPVSSTPVTSTQQRSIPLASTSASTPMASTHQKYIPVASTQQESTPMASTLMASTPVSSTPVTSTPVKTAPAPSTLSKDDQSLSEDQSRTPSPTKEKSRKITVRLLKSKKKKRKKKQFSDSSGSGSGSGSDYSLDMQIEEANKFGIKVNSTERMNMLLEQEDWKQQQQQLSRSSSQASTPTPTEFGTPVHTNPAQGFSPPPLRSSSPVMHPGTTPPMQCTPIRHSPLTHTVSSPARSAFAPPAQRVLQRQYSDPQAPSQSDQGYAPPGGSQVNQQEYVLGQQPIVPSMVTETDSAQGRHQRQHSYPIQDYDPLVYIEPKQEPDRTHYVQHQPYQSNQDESSSEEESFSDSSDDDSHSSPIPRRSRSISPQGRQRVVPPHQVQVHQQPISALQGQHQGAPPPRSRNDSRSPPITRYDANLLDSEVIEIPDDEAPPMPGANRMKATFGEDSEKKRGGGFFASFGKGKKAKKPGSLPIQGQQDAENPKKVKESKGGGLFGSLGRRKKDDTDQQAGFSPNQKSAPPTTTAAKSGTRIMGRRQMRALGMNPMDPKEPKQQPQPQPHGGAQGTDAGTPTGAQPQSQTREQSQRSVGSNSSGTQLKPRGRQQRVLASTPVDAQPGGQLGNVNISETARGVPTMPVGTEQRYHGETHRSSPITPRGGTTGSVAHHADVYGNPRSPRSPTRARSIDVFRSGSPQSPTRLHQVAPPVYRSPSPQSPTRTAVLTRSPQMSLARAPGYNPSSGRQRTPSGGSIEDYASLQNNRRSGSFREEPGTMQQPDDMICTEYTVVPVSIVVG